MRREHIVAFMVLAWSGSARASDRDVAIERASNDLKCDELQMMHAKNQYAFVGCGKRRLYECADGKCDDVTNRKAWAPDGACAALVTTNAALIGGCACLAMASGTTMTEFPVIAPNAMRDACTEVKR